MTNDMVMGLLGVGVTTLLTLYGLHVKRKDERDRQEKAAINATIENVKEGLNDKLGDLNFEVNKHIEVWGLTGREFDKRVKILERESVDEVKVRVLMEDKLRPFEHILEETRREVREDLKEMKGDMKEFGGKVDVMSTLIADLKGILKTRRRDEREDD